LPAVSVQSVSVIDALKLTNAMLAPPALPP
jgi:hypothetical protein